MTSHSDFEKIATTLEKAWKKDTIISSWRNTTRQVLQAEVPNKYGLLYPYYSAVHERYGSGRD